MSVVNAGGYEETSPEGQTPGYTVQAITLLSVDAIFGQGVGRLIWTGYRGPGFLSYQILRREVQGVRSPMTVGTVISVMDTTFADSTVLADEVYEFTVVVETRFGEFTSNALLQSFPLFPIRLRDPVFDSAEASAELRWRPYEGPRFQRYEVVRTSENLAPQIIETLENHSDTSFVDTGLLGNTEYTYLIRVHTERGEQVDSAKHSGLFHGVVDTWDIGKARFARLEKDAGGRVVALLATNRGAPFGTDWAFQVVALDEGGELGKELVRSFPVTISSPLNTGAVNRQDR